jgi:hypothetical protein
MMAIPLIMPPTRATKIISKDKTISDYPHFIEKVKVNVSTTIIDNKAQPVFIAAITSV